MGGLIRPNVLPCYQLALGVTYAVELLTAVITSRQ